MKKRFLSMLLCLIMLVGLFPTGASADGMTDGQHDAIQTYADAADLMPNGEGTQERPYLITSMGELKWFRDEVNSGRTDICARLMGDIDLNEDVNESNWTAIGSAAAPYIGTFDGNYYTIDTNKAKWYMTSAASGLFGYIGETGMIKNLHIQAQTVAADNTSLLSYENRGTIEQCTVEAPLVNGNDVSAETPFCNFAYTNYGTIKNCLSILMARYENAGGFVCSNYGTIESSHCAVIRTNVSTNKNVYAIAKDTAGGMVKNCFCTYLDLYLNVYDASNVTEKHYASIDNNKKVTLMKELAWRLNNNGSTEGSHTDPWRYGAYAGGSAMHYPTLNPTDQKVTIGDGSQTETPHTHRADGVMKEFTALEKDVSLLGSGEGGCYYLESDVSIAGDWEVPDNMTLCLNGHSIEVNGGSVIVPNGISFTVTDCQEAAGTITSNLTGVTVCGGTFVLDNVSVTGCSVGIDYQSGTVKLSGKAKATDNNQNIKLAENQKLTFGLLDGSARFGITYDGTVAKGGEVAITDQTGVKYARQLSSDSDELIISEGSDAIVLASPVEHSHCICGAEHKKITGTEDDGTEAGHISDNPVVYKPWDPYSHQDTNGNPTLPTEPGSYYLTQSVEMADKTYWEPSGDVNLCLNGYTITVSFQQNDETDPGIIKLDEATDSLSVTDCKDTGKIALSATNTSKKNGIRITNGATYNLYGGTMTGFARAVSIGDVRYDPSSGTFNMYGGKLTGNVSGTFRSSGLGSAVYARGTDAKVVMYDGEIVDNKTAGANIESRAGGGVYVGGMGSFIMYGGKISGNGKADAAQAGNEQRKYGAAYGGGVYVFGTFIMKGGEISGNTVSDNFTHVVQTGKVFEYAAYGGGVYVEGASETNPGTFKMTGGKILNNNVIKGAGGGIYIGSNVADALIENAEISGNRAEEISQLGRDIGGGGGIYSWDGLTLKNTTVSGNSLQINKGDSNKYGGGAGMFVGAGGRVPVLIDGCTISGNTMTGKNTMDEGTLGGAGVCVPYTNITVKDSAITDNIATNDDDATDGEKLIIGGMFISRYATPTLSGKVIISGNTVDGSKSNAYLEYKDGTRQGDCILLPGALADGSNIGFTTHEGSTAPVTFAKGTDSYTVTTEDAKRFRDDSERHIAVLDGNAVQFAACTHANGIDKNGKCNDCGAGFVVKIENGDTVTYGVDINDALANAANGSTLTLLSAPLSLRKNVYVPADVAFTLDLNGKTLAEEPLLIDHATGSLKVIDTKGGGQMGFYVWNGTVEFRPNDTSTTISDIAVYGGDVKLYGGNIAKNNWQFDEAGTFNLTRLLPEGYAYRLYQSPGAFLSWVKLEDLQKKGVTQSFNLAIVQCTHPGATAENKCAYCGTDVAVKVTKKDGTDSYFTTLDQSTVDAANGGVITILRDFDDAKYQITEQIVVTDHTFTLELNDHKMIGNIADKKPIFDLRENANVTVKDSGVAYTGAIKSNPAFAINGGSLTIESGTFESGGASVDVITANSGKLTIKGGAFASPVCVYDDRDQNGGVPKVQTQISGGGFEDSLWVRGTSPASLLADGYAFAKIEDGSLVDGCAVDNSGTTVLYKAMVISHPVHNLDAATGKCGCGFVCGHESVNSLNWQCNACGKQAKAQVQKGTNVTWGFDIEEAFASVSAGESAEIVLRSGEHTILNDIPVYGSVTCHFSNTSGSENIVKFDDGHSFVINAGGFLGLGDNMRIGTATVKANGSFGLQDTATVNHLILEENCVQLTNPCLQHGNFGKITVPAGHAVKEVVMQFHDRELSFKHIGGTWATEEELSANEIENVSVSALPFSYPALDIKLDGYDWERAIYNGSNKLSLNVTTKNGSIDSYKWVIDYYAPDSETVTDTMELTAASPEHKLEKVGRYKVKCTITAGGYSKTLTGKEITLDKSVAAYDKKPVKTANLVYNGSPLPLVTAGTAIGGTIQYSLDNIDWADTVPTAENADTYIVYYKIVGDENHSDSQVEHIEVTIAPYEFTGISAVIEKTYDGTTALPDNVSVSFNAAAGSAGVTPSLSKGTDYTITEGAYASSNAGDIDVTLTVKLINTNYVFKDGERTSAEKEFTAKGTINKATDAPEADLGTLTIIKQLNKTYTFDASALLNEPTAPRTYGNIKYKIDSIDLDAYYEGGATINEETGLLTLPIQRYNLAGNDTAGMISITAVTDNYKDIRLTVTVMANYQTIPTGEPTFSKKELTYGDELSKIELSGSLSGKNGDRVTGTFSWKNPTVKPSAGIYTAYWNFTPDADFFMYSTTGGYVDITVHRADSACEAPVKKEGLVYNGNAQPLVTAGTAIGGTMLYSLDGTNWSENIPGGTNADDYIVYYKVQGDENHKDSAAQPIDVSIAQLPVVIRWNNTTGHVYDGSVKTVSAEVTNKKNADVVTVTLGNTYSATDRGDYVASVTAVDNPNYTADGGENTTVNWSIAQAQNTIENLAITGWTYGEMPNAPSANAKFGDIVYSYAAEKNGSYGPTAPIDAGTYWVKAAVEGCSNYTAAQSNPISFDVARKGIDGATVGAFNLTYNGSEQTPTATVTTRDGFAVTGEWSKVTNVSDKTTFTASGNFEGRITDVDTQMAKLPVDSAEITLGEALTYNGGEQTQTIANVKVGTLTLTDADYAVSGNTATDVKTDGDYMLTITGSGNFEGAKQLQWNISPRPPVESDTKKTTARVRRGKTLERASVTNGEILDLNGAALEGTFAWVDSTKVMNANGTEPMIFTPNNANYSALNINVAVTTFSSNSGGGSSSSSATYYTVAFEANGGSKVTGTKVLKNDTVTEPTAPTKDGFAFAGWFTDKGLKNAYDFGTKVTSSFTLYAAWTETVTEPEPEPQPEPTDKPTNPDKTNPFDDVEKDDWFYDDVIDAVEKGLFAGTGSKTFAPNDSITRGMFVTVLYRAEGEPAMNMSVPFADVSNDAYYANAVIWAEQNEIVRGISETEFAPNENITREQIAAIMFRYAKYKGVAPTGAWAIRLDYTDVADISDYAAEGVMYCALKGIMQGKGNNAFAPYDIATRAEIAAILGRFLEANQ